LSIRLDIDLLPRFFALTIFSGTGLRSNHAPDGFQTEEVPHRRSVVSSP
jgi:hypothetical protein